MKKLLQLIGPKGSFARNVGQLLASRVSAQGLTLLAMPFVTRLFSPEDIGVASLAIVFVGVTSTITSLKYEMAIVSEKSERNALLLLKTCLLFILPMSALLTFVGWFLHRYSLFGYENMPTASLAFIFFLLVLTSLQNLLRFYFVKIAAFWPISLQGISFSVGRLLILLGVGVVQANWLIYLIADVIGRSTSFLSVVKNIPIRLLLKLRMSGGRSLALLRKYKQFPMVSVPSTLIDMLSVSLPVPFLARDFGVEAAGLFALVHRVVLGTSSLLGIVIADVFHGRMADRSHDDPGKSYSLFLKTTGVLVLTAIGPVVIFTLFAPELFALVFGEEWRAAGELAVFVAPWAFFGLIVSPTSRVVYVFNWQKSKLIYDVLVLVSTLVVFFLGQKEGWQITKTVATLAAVNCSCYIVYFSILWLQMRKMAKNKR